MQTSECIFICILNSRPERAHSGSEMNARAAHITSLMQISLCRVKQRASQVWESRGNVREIWIASQTEFKYPRITASERVRAPLFCRTQWVRERFLEQPAIECATAPNTFSLEWEESEAKKLLLCAQTISIYNNDKDFLNLYFSYCFSRWCMEVVAGFLKKE